jgi:hypothetical protein
MYPFADGLVRNNEEWSVRNDTSWLEEVKMRIRAVLLAILVTGILAFAALTPSQAQAPSALLIRGATIIDGISDAAETHSVAQRPPEPAPRSRSRPSPPKRWLSKRMKSSFLLLFYVVPP